MSRRKHVTLGLRQEIEAPGPNQQVVQVTGNRGGNIVEVVYPDGRQTLCLIPNKFNKKLWVKRGGYLLVEEGQQQGQGQEQGPGEKVSEIGQASTSGQGQGKVTGVIIAVLYDDHIKQLKKLPGAWPPEFELSSKSSVLQRQQSDALGDIPGGGDSEPGKEEEGSGHRPDEEEEEEEDDGLPALELNTNRRVIVHEVSDDSDEDDEE